MHPGDASHDDEEAGVEAATIDRIARIAGRMDDEDFARVDPPAHVWARIAAAVADADADGTPAPAPTRTPTPTLTPREVVGASAPVVSLHARRRRMNRIVAVAVAAAVVLLAATGMLLVRGGSTPDDQQLVAATALAPLEPTDATADVRLVRDDGDLRLELEAHDMAGAPAGHHYELWLLDPTSASAAPVSLGAMTGSVTVPVPADVDVDRYDVVDVSLQRDGQTQHSSHSLLRGTLA